MWQPVCQEKSLSKIKDKTLDKVAGILIIKDKNISEK